MNRLQEKRAYTYQGTVQVGKFSVVCSDNSQAATGTKDGFVLPNAMNDPADFPIGIVEEGIVPTGATDYISGSYEGISQAAWPNNLAPTTPQGNYRRTVVTGGPIRARAAGAWKRGERLIVADNLGHLASVVTLNLPANTPIRVVAIADEPASALGDVAQVIVGIKNELV